MFQEHIRFTELQTNYINIILKMTTRVLVLAVLMLACLSLTLAQEGLLFMLHKSILI